MKKLILTLILLSLAAQAFAQEPKTARQRETFKDKLIGYFVKTFAKTYVATHNLEKFKEKNIKKLQKMDEVKFQRVYSKIYQETMMDLPQNLKELWGVEENMTREKAIARLDSFKTKKQIYKIINSVPNTMIAQHFKKHKEDFKEAMQSREGPGVDGAVDQLLADPSGAS